MQVLPPEIEKHILLCLDVHSLLSYLSTNKKAQKRVKKLTPEFCKRDGWEQAPSFYAWALTHLLYKKPQLDLCAHFQALVEKKDLGQLQTFFSEKEFSQEDYIYFLKSLLPRRDLHEWWCANSTLFIKTENAWDKSQKLSTGQFITATNFRAERQVRRH